MIEVGDRAPEFEATDSRGEPFRLSSLRGRSVILYFFPKAFTGGCTIETQQFAALAPALTEKGVQVVGVSVDSAETEQRFAAHCGATFPIVSDAGRTIARSYGVLSLLGFSKRVTFFLDESGTVREIVTGMLPGPHLAKAKSRYLPETARPPPARNGP